MSDKITAELYGGEVIVDFSPKAHRYKIRGKDAYPDGVTTICNAVVPKYLDDWAGRVCVGYVRDGYLESLERTGQPPEQSAFLALCEEGETTHQRVRDSAGDRGSKAHDYIEKVLTGGEVEPPDDPLVMAALNAFSKWQDEWPCEIMECERIIHSRKHYYCGKTDVYGLVSGRPSVIDFKTGSGFYADHPYQLTGYAFALEEELGVKIEDGYIVHLNKETKNYKVYHVPLDGNMKVAWEFAVDHYKKLKQVKKLVEGIKGYGF